MDTYTATALAYNNGYEQGYEQGKKDAVKHGEWILVAENSTGLIYVCSSCDKPNNPNEDDVAHGRAKEKPDFCPNCGSRMDGGNEDG